MSSGNAAVANTWGFGTCDCCGTEDVELFTMKDFLPPVEIRKVLPPKRQTHPAHVFAWSLILMAAALSLALCLISRCSHGAPKETLEEYCQRTIRRLPVFYEDNPPGGVAGRTDEKERQLMLIASEVARVSRKKAPLGARVWANLIFTVGFHESTFSVRIHQGNCRPHECDGGRARGPFQPHRNLFNKDRWDLLFGVQNTAVQVDVVDDMLRRQVRACDGQWWIEGSDGPVELGTEATVKGILTGYGGRRCNTDWPGLGARLETFRRLSQ